MEAQRALNSILCYTYRVWHVPHIDRSIRNPDHSRSLIDQSAGISQKQRHEQWAAHSATHTHTHTHEREAAHPIRDEALLSWAHSSCLTHTHTHTHTHTQGGASVFCELLFHRSCCQTRHTPALCVCVCVCLPHN